MEVEFAERGREFAWRRGGQLALADARACAPLRFLRLRHAGIGSWAREVFSGSTRRSKISAPVPTSARLLFASVRICRNRARGEGKRNCSITSIARPAYFKI